MSTTDARLAMMRAVRAGRARLDMSQQELADLMGDSWDARMVSRVEAGERSVRWEEIPALCRALQMPLRRMLDDLDDDDRAAIGLPPMDDSL